VHEVTAASIPNARSALVGGGHLIDPADRPCWRSFRRF
jgi:hypothetical protein